MPEWRDDRQYENPEELCAGLEWMKDRGIVSREHTLRLSWYDGRVIANKNDHLGRLIDKKRRAMATMIITQCLKSYDINAYGQYDLYGWTPLFYTVIYEEPELCRLLCERGDVDVDKGYKYGGATALHFEANCGRMECMRILLDVGKANVDAKDNRSSTPLHYAASGGHPEIEAATLLIERGAEINPINDSNRTPLDSAHMCNRTAMIVFLKTKGAVRAPQPVVEESSGEESSGEESNGDD